MYQTLGSSGLSPSPNPEVSPSLPPTTEPHRGVFLRWRGGERFERKCNLKNRRRCGKKNGGGRRSWIKGKLQRVPGAPRGPAGQVDSKNVLAGPRAWGKGWGPGWSLRNDKKKIQLGWDYQPKNKRQTPKNTQKSHLTPRSHFFSLPAWLCWAGSIFISATPPPAESQWLEKAKKAGSPKWGGSLPV